MCRVPRRLWSRIALAECSTRGAGECLLKPAVLVVGVFVAVVAGGRDRCRAAVVDKTAVAAFGEDSVHQRKAGARPRDCKSLVVET